LSGQSAEVGTRTVADAGMKEGYGYRTVKAVIESEGQTVVGPKERKRRMKLIFPILLMSLLLSACMTLKKDLRISMRDAVTKEAASEGHLTLKQCRLFSSGVGYGVALEKDGVARIDKVETGNYLMTADVKGYDLADVGFTFTKYLPWPKGKWIKMENRRSYPLAPSRQLEFRLEVIESD